MSCKMESYMNRLSHWFKWDKWFAFVPSFVNDWNELRDNIDFYVVDSY
jgi:hypothetical protein